MTEYTNLRLFCFRSLLADIPHSTAAATNETSNSATDCQNTRNFPFQAKEKNSKKNAHKGGKFPKKPSKSISFSMANPLKEIRN